jgi:uncharacterized protein DUF3008
MPIRFSSGARSIYVCLLNQRNSKWQPAQRLQQTRGKKSKSSLKGASRSMYKSMSKAELRRMAKTKRKGKPTKKKRR